jgi:hypothetical protein
LKPHLAARGGADRGLPETNPLQQGLKHTAQQVSMSLAATFLKLIKQ